METKVFSSPFYPALLVVTAKSMCGVYVQFNEKKDCFVVLNQSFIKVFAFHTGDFDSVDEKKVFYPGECCNTSQGWGFCTWCPPTDVPAVFSLCSIQKVGKRKISRKLVLGHLLQREEK